MASFMNDPDHGLSKLGWQSYGKEKAVLLGSEDKYMEQIAASEPGDGGC